MTTSKDALENIDNLMEDLSARVEVQTVSSKSGRCGINGDYGEQSYTDYFDENGELLHTASEYGTNDIDRRGETKPDVSTRLKAVNQIGTLYREGIDNLKDVLIKTYQNNDLGQVRIQAGKELGYSGLRIWVHEHPNTAKMTCIGVASGLVYTLIEYLSK